MKIRDLLECCSRMNESKSSPLYHATGIYRACDILKSNTLLANTDQYFGDDKVMGVSLSRDLNFVKGPSLPNPRAKVIFVLDQEKLSHNYKIKPINYFTTHHDINLPKDEIESGIRKGLMAEAEEFVIGDIKNLDKYIIKIIIPKTTYRYNEDNLKRAEGQTQSFASEMAKKYLIIKNNPKTVIEK